MNKSEDTSKRWFVMRDLTRVNAKEPAYRFLTKQDVEVFTPLTKRLIVKAGKKSLEEVPFIHDLLFVHSSREALDPIVNKKRTLQYRYIFGGFCEPMVVPTAEMEKFICAVRSTEAPRYYLPEEVTPQMYGHKIRIVGGNLDGYEGNLITTRGSKTKRLLVEIPGILFAGVEVEPDFLQILN